MYRFREGFSEGIKRLNKLGKQTSKYTKVVPGNDIGNFCVQIQCFVKASSIKIHNTTTVNVSKY